MAHSRNSPVNTHLEPASTDIGPDDRKFANIFNKFSLEFKFTIWKCSTDEARNYNGLGLRPVGVLCVWTQ